VARKYLGPSGGKRRRNLLLLFPLAAVAALVFVLTASAGTISTASGFEGDDGNLAVDSTFDWNGFSPVTWTGSAPKQLGTKLASGWQFSGSTDAAASTSDDGFAGGTKQDKDCASVIGTKAPNKDDLKRIYTAHKTVNGHIYLALAWVRIPQNTTSASAHVGFEFNQGSTSCGTGSPLVKRTAGDMLIVYDFAGSTTDNPILTVRRWVLSGSCDVSSDSAPCWGPATDLTGTGFANAKVNTVSTAQDTVAPTSETLGLNEFGEAVIDLTGAGIFTGSTCTSFGQAEGVSRSSGNSGQAAMEDLVGPIPVTISNCGHLVVKKVTVPSPDPTNTSFSFSENGSNNTGTLPKTFSLTNGQTNSTQVFPATDFSVAETVPSGWSLTSASCDNSSGSLSGSTLSSISVAVDETVTCTFTNTLQQGAIKITKTSSKAAATPLAGATFTIKSNGTPISGSPFTTDANGVICVDGLKLGDYSVQETGAPSGYAIDDSTAHTVTVDNAAKCNDSTYVGETIGFTDTPLTNLTITVSSQVTGGTQSTITCTKNSDSSNIGNSPQGPLGSATVTANGLKPGDYTCAVNIDP
jgi:Prealbumin-like fold domain